VLSGKLEMKVPKWLRVTLYVLAGVMGVGGAALGFSKGATMLAILAVALAIEGANYLAQRGKGS
jgi:hypothetical protein